MKTITCSDRIDYDELLPEKAQAIGQEALDFEKKSEMRYGNQRLSEFATKQIQEALERRCRKEGDGVI